MLKFRQYFLVLLLTLVHGHPQASDQTNSADVVPFDPFVITPAQPGTQRYGASHGPAVLADRAGMGDMAQPP